MVKTKLLNIDCFQENAISQIIVGKRLFSSHQTDWENIVLEYWSRVTQEIPTYSAKQHTVIIRIKNKGITERKLDGILQQENNQIGDIVFVPASIEHWANFKQDAEVIILSLAPKALATLAYDEIDPERVKLTPKFAHSDLTIEQIGRALLAELQADYNCKLYAETLANAMFAHLLRKYSAHQKKIKEYKDGLSCYRLKQALNYIDSHFDDRSLKLSDIAREIHISPYYFCRLFKKSVGITPYKYIVQQRIKKAKLLLKKDRELSVADIAVDCGFSHQSHMTNCFRKVTKRTPRFYRK